MNKYFITGATGVLGSEIVRELLLHTSSQLVLLIRSRNRIELKQRLEWLTSYLGVNAKVMAKRVEVFQGDIESERLGLDLIQYLKLSASVSHIIHSAANVRMNLPLADARRAAVGATENILQFARLCHEKGNLQKIEMVSTVGIGGRWQGYLPEEWIDEPRVFHNTYERAKAEAEMVIQRQTVEYCLPVTVHRPSMIIGNSKTGRVFHFQIFYHLVEFISGRRTYGMLPDLSGHYIDLVPVDYVAQVIVWSSQSEHAIGRILHLCSGAKQAVALDELKKIIVEKFQKQNLIVPRQIILPVFWLKLFTRFLRPLVSRNLSRRLKSLPMFLDYLSEDQFFSNTSTMSLLTPFGFYVPSSKEYLDPVLDYYLSKTYMKSNSSFGLADN